MRNLLIVLLTIALGCHDRGSQRVTQTPVQMSVVPAVIRDSGMRERRCGINFDGTVSVDPSARKEYAKRFEKKLPGFTRDLGCTTISVSVFTDGGWFTKVPQFDMPKEQHTPCDAGSLTPSRRVLQPFAGFQQLTNDRCAQQLADENTKNERAREEALAPIRAALQSVDAVQSSCTDLYTHLALLDRISQPEDIDFVITDGFQTCQSPVKPFAPHHRVIFVIATSTGDERTAANHGIASAVDLTAQFRGSTYLLPAELMAEHWWMKGVQQ